jgi:hypothetical protein
LPHAHPSKPSFNHHCNKDPAVFQPIKKLAKAAFMCLIRGDKAEKKTGSWNTIPGPYNQSDGRFYYIEDAREGRRFFRLLKIRQ